MINLRAMNLGSSPAAIIGAVVCQSPLLGRGLHVFEPGRDVSVGVANALRVGDRRGALEDIQGLAGIAGGKSDEMLERLTREGHAAARSEVAREAAFRVGERAPHHRGDLLVGEWLEAIDAKPGQERRVHLEVGVLGGGAGECDRALLDVRQQRVLLGFIEAMDLVDEEDRSLAVENEPVASLGYQRSNLGNAAHNRRDGYEARSSGIGKDPCQARLATPRRSPEEE
jgi:hypothetical protein